jgi:hypothetical protein
MIRQMLWAVSEKSNDNTTPKEWKERRVCAENEKENIVILYSCNNL